MYPKPTNSTLYNVFMTASDFCSLVQDALEYSKEAFVAAATTVLPKLYVQFVENETSDSGDLFPPNYMDESYYDSIRRNLEMLFGEDDTFLETFEEDMKYSETPIGASVAEELADIFQDLYNFVVAVKESEGATLEESYAICRENFDAYWSQTLCNVMRPLNRLRLNS